jgi:hypothetical protein
MSDAEFHRFGPFFSLSSRVLFALVPRGSKDATNAEKRFQLLIRIGLLISHIVKLIFSFLSNSTQPPVRPSAPKPQKPLMQQLKKPQFDVHHVKLSFESLKTNMKKMENIIARRTFANLGKPNNILAGSQMLKQPKQIQEKKYLLQQHSFKRCKQ